MANKIFPAGTGVTTRTAAELVASDMYFIGTSVAATADAVAYDTKFSSARVAIAGLLAGYDTVIAEYKNTTTITVKAGGQYSANGILYTITSDFDLATNTDLTTDDTLTANTWYYIVTNGTTYKLSDATTCSDVSNGVALGAGISIYNDSGTLKIRPFDMRGRWYRYRTEITLFYGTAPTTSTSLSLAAYVPASVKLANLTVRSAAITSVAPSNINLSFDGVTFSRLIIGQFMFDGTNQQRVMRGGCTTVVQRSMYWYADLAFPSFTLALNEVEV